MPAVIRNCMVLFMLVLVTACHRDSEPDSHAEAAKVRFVSQAAGPTPFIAQIRLRLEQFSDLESVAYFIAPRPGSHASPVSVTYSRARLERTGAWQAADKELSFAVFGLYANHLNALSLTLRFHDGSEHVERFSIATPAYDGPAAVYNTPNIRQPLGAGARPGLDFILLKNSLGTPVVLDTDGVLRWVAVGLPQSNSTLFDGSAFVVGSATEPTFTRLELDGTYSTTPLATTRYTNFHHDLSAGKRGYLAEVDGIEGGVAIVESILAEIDADGQVLKEWDLAAIFRAAMRAGGDDPDNFVRDGVDWFHMNSAIYVPADDSLLISSRENFVVKLDYETGRILWLLGDTSKHWYVNFPSLRALALELTSGKPPNGQHALSIASTGDLLLFNNGFGSASQPPGTPAGPNDTVSTAARYAIDEQARVAREVWRDNSAPDLYSDICSSVFETTPGNYLVTYSVSEQRTVLRLRAVDNDGNLAFDYAFPTTTCTSGFIGQPINFQAFKLD